jgi:putative RecB family exonuclease
VADCEHPFPGREAVVVSTFSHSRIDTFETCPKKYEFAYLLKVPRGPAGIEAFMGNRVHEALEWLYTEVRACRLPDEEDLVARYMAAWEAEWEDAVRVTRTERTAEDYRAIGEKALRAYHRRYHPFDQGVTIGLEARIALRLDEDHEIVGYIDRLVKVADGEWEIHDYKTGATLMTQEKADADRQLALYELAVREMYPDAQRVTFVWHYLAFDHEVRSVRTEEQRDRLRAQVLDAIRHIEAQSAFPARTSSLCDWCDYQAICPAWRHRFEVAALPEEERAAEDGVALVDEYLRTGDEITRLKARQDVLRDAIADRAGAEGLDRLFGTDGSVKVYRYPSVRFPDVKDPRRPDLEEEVRAMELWDRFSVLSSYPLSRAIEDGSLDAAQLARLEPYISRGEGVKLYPSRRT